MLWAGRVVGPDYGTTGLAGVRRRRYRGGRPWWHQMNGRKWADVVVLLFEVEGFFLTTKKGNQYLKTKAVQLVSRTR